MNVSVVDLKQKKKNEKNNNKIKICTKFFFNLKINYFLKHKNKGFSLTSSCVCVYNVYYLHPEEVLLKFFIFIFLRRLIIYYCFLNEFFFLIISFILFLIFFLNRKLKFGFLFISFILNKNVSDIFFHSFWGYRVNLKDFCVLFLL